VAARGLDIPDVVRFWLIVLKPVGPILFPLLTEWYVPLFRIILCNMILQMNQRLVMWTVLVMFCILIILLCWPIQLWSSGLHPQSWSYCTWWKRQRKCIIVLVATRTKISYLSEGNEVYAK
jgi:hypothetical protein